MEPELVQFRQTGAFGWGQLVVALVAVTVTSLLTKFVRYMLLRPLKIKWAMEKQGIKSTPFRPVLGDFLEFQKLDKEANSRDVDGPTNHDIMWRTNAMFSKLRKLYNGQPVVWFWGPEARMTITDPEQVKQVYANRLTYVKPDIAVSFLQSLLGNGLVTAQGEDWVNQRLVVAPAFHSDKLKDMTGEFVTSTSLMLEEWERLVNNSGLNKVEIDVSSHLANVTADIIARTAFGTTCYKEGKELFDKQAKIGMLATTAGRYLWIPGFKFFPVQHNRALWKAQNEITKGLREIIQARRDSVILGKSASFGNDLLGIMLSVSEDNHKANPTQARLTNQQVVDECKTFFFAGHETTAVSLTWTLMLLSVYPEWQDRLRKEVQEVCKGASPDGQNLGKLKLVGMVLNESMRLYPPVPHLSRQAAKDLWLGNLLIPKGLTIITNQVQMHHDPQLWGEDALEFNPERFAGGISKASKIAGAFMPFSSGPRNCVGQNFAVMEAKVLLAMMVQRFSFHLSPSYRHAPHATITLRPDYGMPLIVERLQS